MAKNKKEEKKYYESKSRRDWKRADAFGKVASVFLGASLVLASVGFIFAAKCDRNIKRAAKCNK